KFWKPRNEWHFDKPGGSHQSAVGSHQSAVSSQQEGMFDPHAKAAAALFTADSAKDQPEKPLTTASGSLAWALYAIMSVLLLLTGIVRQKETPVREGPGPVQIIGSLHTNYQLPIPTLHNQVFRDAALQEPGKEQEPESALFNFAWLTAPG